MQLNRNKILGRLESAKFVRPKHVGKIRGPLPTGLRKVLQNNIEAALQRKARQEAADLDRDISSFEAAFIQLEKCTTAEDILYLQRIIKQAYELTENGVNLPNRLRALGCPKSLSEARDVREAGKVANYWRIARHLTMCATRYRSHFANLEWRPVSNYHASPGSSVVRQKYTHAEIQLLVHYELFPTEPPPRVIGVSKEACFLCDSFLRAHGRFSITGAHRQMFPQWTVPDLQEYNQSTVERFRKILSQVVVEVNKEFVKSRKKSPWRPFPAQSAINLNVVHLMTPSISTILMQSSAESRGETPGIDSGSGDSTSVSTLAKRSANSLGPRGTEKDERHSASSIAESHQLPNISPEVLHRIDMAVNVDEADLRKWIRPFAYFFASPTDDISSGSGAKRFTSGGIILEPVTEDEQVRTIHLHDIPTERDLVVERNANDTETDEMSFVVVGNQGQGVRFRCQWHMS